MTANTPPPVSLPNSAQHLLDTEHGTLQIMVSWPLAWKPDGSTTEAIADVPVMYVLLLASLVFSLVCFYPCTC